MQEPNEKEWVITLIFDDCVCGIGFDTFHLFQKRCHQKSSANVILKRNCLRVCVKKSLEFKCKGIVLRNLVFVYAYTDGCVSVYLCIYTCACTCLKCAQPTYMRKKQKARFKQCSKDKQIVKE